MTDAEINDIVRRLRAWEAHHPFPLVVHSVLADADTTVRHFFDENTAEWGRNTSDNVAVIPDPMRRRLIARDFDRGNHK